MGTTLGPLIVTAVLTSGHAWRWSYVIVGSAQLLLAATFFVTRARWAHLPIDAGGTARPPVAAVGFVAEGAGLATIGVSVVVLTLALLALYQVVVWRGRRGEVAVERRGRG